jgi:hypothetical protein
MPATSTLSLLQTTQRYSSYVFSGFFGIHVINNVIVPLATWGQGQNALQIDSAFGVTRRIYRPSALIEFGVVFVPLVVHVASGVILRFYRLKSLYPKGIGEWHREKTRGNIAANVSHPHLHAIPTFGLSDVASAGYITAFCVAFHVVMVRYLPSANVSITIVTRAMQKHPRIFYTFYYSLFSAGVFHIVSGWGKWLKLTTTPRSILVKNAVVAVINFSWIAAIIRVGSLGIPESLLRQYDAVYSRFWKQF